MLGSYPSLGSLVLPCELRGSAVHLTSSAPGAEITNHPPVQGTSKGPGNRILGSCMVGCETGYRDLWGSRKCLVRKFLFGFVGLWWFVIG